MRKIRNPFLDVPGYKCFGCSPDNETGLRMDFFEDGEEIVSIWKPEQRYEGWLDILHGGIQATLLDEIASWVVFVKFLTSGVTSNINMDLLKPVHISKGDITLRARLLKKEKRLAHIETTLFDGEGTLCAKALVTYFVYPREVAERKLFSVNYEVCLE